MLGMFLAALDQTVVSTAIRTIADDLQGYDLQAWATTAFLITSTIATPLYGKLSDLYGRRPFYLFAIGVFVVGSMLCGLADSMYQLAAYRALQGIGAGGLMSLALAIIGDIVPPAGALEVPGLLHGRLRHVERARPGHRRLPRRPGLAAGHRPAGAGSSTSTCRSALLAFAVVMRVLHLPHTRRDHRIDWPGALALITCLVPLLIVAEQGRTWGWDSGGALALLRHRRRRLRRSSSSPSGPTGTTPCCRCACSGTAASPSAASAASSWAPACSAASCCSRSTCRSCTAPARRSPACR